MSCAIYPGMTAAEARAVGEDVPSEVPDDAVLAVDSFVCEARLAEDGRVSVQTTILGARWEWVAEEESAPN